MSFFVVAVVLAWEACQALQHAEPLWRGSIYLFAAAASIALGIAGMREKHRRS